MANRTQSGPYFAVVDRSICPKPPLPALGAAGVSIADPAFGSRILRLTDAQTDPAAVNQSYRSPSSPHTAAFSSDGKWLWLTSTNGTIYVYAVDAALPKLAAKPGFYFEPHFSRFRPGKLIGARNADAHTIEEFDVPTGAWRTILDFTPFGGGPGTYLGTIDSSATGTAIILYGGTAQDKHPYVALFDEATGALGRILDARASLPLPLTGLHHVAIDRTGQYVTLYTTGVDQSPSTLGAPQSYVWDLANNTFKVPVFPYGHDSHGYGVSINQDNSGDHAYDAVQWQFRNLLAMGSPGERRDVMVVPLTPKEVNAEDHSSWNNAQPDKLLPFVSAIIRYGLTTYGATPSPWRALDDEIIAVDPWAPGKDPTIWRFCHHRSNVSYDGVPRNPSFWYEPRPNVSPDGTRVLFTSNWEKTLGTDPKGDAGCKFRQDAFLLTLAASDPGAGGGGTAPTIQDALKLSQQLTAMLAVLAGQ